MVRKIKGTTSSSAISKNIVGLGAGGRINIDGSKLLEFRTVVNEYDKSEDCIYIYAKDKTVYNRITNDRSLVHDIIDKLYIKFPFLKDYRVSYGISDIGYINYMHINHKLKKNFNEMIKAVNTVSISLSNYIEEDATE